MADISLAGWAGLFLLSCVASLAVLWLAGGTLLRPRPSSVQPAASASHFLFDGDRLTDHDVTDLPTGAGQLDAVETWSDLRSWLKPRFDNLPETLEGGNENIWPDPDATGMQLHRSGSGSFTRIALTNENRPSPAAWHHTLRMADDGSSARLLLDYAPYPIWQTGRDGRLIWGNAACVGIRDADGRLPTRPKGEELSNPHRFSVTQKGEKTPTWYELRSRPADGGQVHYACEITQVIRAETVQREFVQTLTKTFANLTTGLAIFDRNRRLALFNPALVDLTGVPVTFLSVRPGLMQFFDELRERQVLPEPKDYASWRGQINDVVDQASDGFYQETWTLPTGLTYKVTGRPHPDGAIAFLFEDISAEISLTRRFRAQIDLGHAVLDGLDTAIAVVASNQLLTFCNRACSALLKIDPDTSFADMNLKDLLASCRAHITPDENWNEFERSLLSGEATSAPAVRLDLRDGRAMDAGIHPLPGGARMLRFLEIARTDDRHKATPVS